MLSLETIESSLCINSSANSTLNSTFSRHTNERNVTWRALHTLDSQLENYRLLSSLGTGGFARVYLGEHYPSDILAGWAAASAWTVVAYLLVFPHGKRPWQAAAD